MSDEIETREAWLHELTQRLRPLFEGVGYPLPEKIRTSCGFPSKGALATKTRRIGEAWSSDNSEDKHFETFVSPLVADAVEVAAIQVHELVHCAVGVSCKHRNPFPKCARAVGLEGKMTATIAGNDLKVTLAQMVAEIGPYPHAKLVHSSVPKKQTTRMLKVVCPICGYTVRTSQKWLDVGVPTCPCGELMKADSPDVEPEKSDDVGD